MTTPPDRIAIVPPQPAELARTVEAVVASLPVSLGIADDGRLAAVHGADEGWCDQARAAIAAGAAGVLIDRPCHVAARRVAALASTARERGAKVVVRMRWAHPALDDAAIGWSSAMDGLVIIDSFVSGVIGAPRDAVAAQVFALATVAGPLRALHADVVSPKGYTLRAIATRGVPVAIAGAATDLPPELLVRMLGRTEAFELQLPDTTTWRPALAFRASDTGEDRRPPIYESADRAAWRRLRDVVLGGTDCDDLDRLAGAFRLIDEVGADRW